MGSPQYIKREEDEQDLFDLENLSTDLISLSQNSLASFHCLTRSIFPPSPLLLTLSPIFLSPLFTTTTILSFITTPLYHFTNTPFSQATFPCLSQPQHVCGYRKEIPLNICFILTGESQTLLSLISPLSKTQSHNTSKTHKKRPYPLDRKKNM
eukprot:TRINITY_DN2980_c0_g1_i6.p1 TRINITY_DN2980_c0_g1~~TRINITY_DN2980_c0_g1_i6.p1  ORF type:complete len:153 (-),score=17.98 TRINITY_DN2980_c0_g1_i6:57-515(-)